MKKIFSNAYCILFLSSLIVYFWSVHFGFLPYDDHINIYENPYLLKGHWLEFWAHPYLNLYVPVVYTAWTFLFKLFGLNPVFFHLTGVLLHTLNACFTFLMMTRMRIPKLAALAGALFFLLHPLQVEAVVWATGLKDTLFLFLSLCAIWFFHFEKRQWSGLVFATLAMLTKPTAVVLPVFFALMFWLQAANFREFLRSSTKLIISGFVALAVIVVSKQQQAADIDASVTVNIFERMLIVLDTLGFYLIKLIYPVNLYAYYDRVPRRVLEQHLYWINAAVALAFIVAAVFWIKKNRNSESNIFGAALALLFFLPTSGIVSFGFQKFSTTSDRYMYPVIFALSFLLAGLVNTLLSHPRRDFYLKLVFAGLFILGVSSYVQTLTWSSYNTFLETQLEGNPNSYKVLKNLGGLRQFQGKDSEAFELFSKAHELEPLQLAPISGILSVYFNAKDFAKMDEVTAAYLTPENFKKLEGTDKEKLSFFRLLIFAELQQNKTSEAEKHLCKVQKINLAERDPELDTILAKIPAEQCAKYE